MPKINFVGGKFSPVNKAKCNKSFELVLRLEKFQFSKRNFEILATCKDCMLANIKILADDKKILEALKKVIIKHEDIIFPAKLRHPMEFELCV